MTEVIIRGLPSLDNYGTAMMAMVTIQALAAHTPGKLVVRCNLYPTTDVDEIYSELDVDRDRVSIVPFVRRPRPRLATPAGSFYRLKMLAGSPDTADGNLYIVLGGDDLSEYYGAKVWRQLFSLWLSGRTTPVVLLGQTIGPFNKPMNRMAANLLMPQLRVVARDRWTTNYLQSEFGLGDRLQQGADLAWADLPLQHRKDIEQEVLDRFGLTPETYATVVVSGMQVLGYYTPDRAIYLQRWKETVEALLDMPEMAGRRVCLLAHTYGGYGDEGQNVEEVFGLLSDSAKARVVPIADRILPTRARFVLGNGLFTITGRMHPAVSTFQMGKPAITLAYSKKYEGVIGTMIGRSDLILEGNDPALWSSGAIVATMLDKVREVLANHEGLCAEIRKAVAQQKTMVEASLADTLALITQAAPSSRA